MWYHQQESKNGLFGMNLLSFNRSIFSNTMKNTNTSQKSEIHDFQTEQENQMKIKYIQSEVSPNLYDNFKDFALRSFNFSVDNLKDISIQTLIQMIDDFKSSLNKRKLSKEFDEFEFRNSDEKIVFCKGKLLNKTSLNYVMPKVSVINPKIFEPGIFSSKYILYEVKTDPLNWVVKRRFSDFENLRLLLVKFFPGQCIPPLPPKQTGNKRFEEEFVEKRR